MTSLLCVVGLCLSSGCAYTDAHLDLTYQMPRPSEPGIGHRIQAPIIVDDRSERHRIGVKKTREFGGMDSANVHLASYAGDVTAWVYDVLVAELRAAGIKVTEGDRPSSQAPRLVVTLRQFYVETESGLFGFSLHGLVRVTLTVTLPDGRSFERRVKGYKDNEHWTPTDDDFEAVLLEASELALRDSAKYIAELLMDQGS